MKCEAHDGRGAWEGYASLLCAVLLHPASEASGWFLFSITKRFSGHQFVFLGGSAFYSADLGRLIGSILVVSFCIGFGISAIRKRKVLVPIISMVFSSLFFLGRVLPMFMHGHY